MSDYDLVVLGGGTGNLVAAAAANRGEEVALVERDRLGGTCLNRGCNPSKQLIHRANVAETVREAESYGVDASIDGIAYEEIVAEVTAAVTEEAEEKAERARANDRVTLYRAEGRFVDDHAVEIDVGDGERITGDDVVLAGGSRPMVPDAIDGTDEVDYLTSADALRLETLPDRLVIVGGGYVAVEMAHFFGAMGAEVTVVGRSDVLAGGEDRDVAERLTAAYRDRFDLRLGYEASALAEDGEATVVAAEGDDGDEIRVAGDEVLLATGRRPNSDSWAVDAAGLETDDRGFVETDEYLETSVDGVWAIGDIAGNYMFKHSGDKEAEYVVANAVDEEREAVEYPGMAHAIFGSPEVGSLGETESEVDGECEVGTFAYGDTALGTVVGAEGDFAKAVVAPDGEVLGFHAVGPHASMLVHEVATAVAAGADAERIAETIHVHPALSEVVQGAFSEVLDVAPRGF